VAAKTGSRGQLRGHSTGSCEEYGIEEGSVSIIIRTFMEIRTETPIHWIDMVKGVLLFAQTQPNDPGSGVIYVYDKTGRDFWSLKFDDGQGRAGNQFLTRQEFEALAEEYSLDSYAACPALLAGLTGATA
jgi:hypothetical protein